MKDSDDWLSEAWEDYSAHVPRVLRTRLSELDRRKIERRFYRLTLTGSDWLAFTIFAIWLGGMCASTYWVISRVLRDNESEVGVRAIFDENMNPTILNLDGWNTGVFGVSDPPVRPESTHVPHYDPVQLLIDKGADAEEIRQMRQAIERYPEVVSALDTEVEVEAYWNASVMYPDTFVPEPLKSRLEQEYHAEQPYLKLDIR